MSKKRNEAMTKTKHSSIDMPDPDAIKDKKKQDMITKARNKFFDALKSRNAEGEKKSRTQATIDYLFKPCPSPNKIDKHQVFSNSQAQQNGCTLKRAASLQKQHSVGSYPLKIDLTDDNLHPITRQRPATVCVDKIQDEGRETAALALERPRKKLSFREPEIMGYAIQLNRETLPRKGGRKAFTPEMKRSFSNNVGMKKVPSVDLDDLELESQAMRIVRTVGQAFEVCHKLAITAPETENLDYDEQETLTQDLVSDRLSDVTSDKPKKDLTSECASDKVSLPDENCTKDNSSPTESNKTNSRPFHLDLLSLPSNPNSNCNNTLRKSPMTSGETYASPHSDGFPTGGTGSCGSSIPATTGTALSAHHEIQLLREQLEQQGQQTQAAMAQLQLAREQLAAEQSARLEAQARTHQLLVHNRELLDHIAALVAHLQGGEKGPHQPQTSPHVTMPQQQQFQGLGGDGCYSGDHQDQSPLDHSMLQALGLNPQGLIENRAVTSCLPSSPLRTTFNPSGGVFTFPHPQNDISLEAQLLQRLQSLCGYTPPQYPYNLNQNIPFMPSLYAQPMVNNNYTLQPPPQKKLPPSPLAVRHSYTGSPILEKRVSPGKNDSMQNLNYQSQQNLALQQQYQMQQNFGTNYQSNSNISQSYQSNPNVNQAYQTSPNVNHYPSNQNLNQIPQQNSQHLQVQSNVQQRQSPQRNLSPKSDQKSEPLFIKPLSQMGTLTTTDTGGRVRVIVPVPASDEASAMAALRINDDFRPNVPAITRSTSEKVPNRSELMSQVQRTAWARHTTK